MFTKRVAMRAVNLSTGPFCTEFRCEQLCDDDIFFGSGSILCFFTKRVAMRAVDLSIGPFCTEFRCEQLCDNEVSGIGVIFLAPRHKIEMVMKVVLVRAVNLSIGPFCTEFRCEHFCDDTVFGDRSQLSVNLWTVSR